MPLTPPSPTLSTTSPPFPYVRESFDYLLDKADMIVVSQTPGEALEREWAEHSLKKYVRIIAGQERGTKTEPIALASGGKYQADHALIRRAGGYEGGSGQ